MITDDRLYVRYSHFLRYWKVSGREGDYGLTRTQYQALAIACDASLTASYWPGPGRTAIPHGQRPIVVEDRYGQVRFIITRVRGKASPQFFQDAVP